MKVLVDAIMNYGGGLAVIGGFIGLFIGNAANEAAHCFPLCPDVYKYMFLGAVLGFVTSRVPWVIKKINKSDQ